MSDYITREAALEAMYKDAEAHPGHTFWATQHEALRNIPAADVRPVVLCRDCMLRQYCKLAQYLGEDGFCSNGEKREEI